MKIIAISAVALYVAVGFAQVSEADAVDGGVVSDRERLAASASSAGGAQQPGESGRGRPIEEVVVTAQKREERLHEVPISISVVTGEELDTSTLTNLTETLSRVPGVVALAPSNGNPIIIIRGAPPSGAGGTIGYYIDSVPFGFSRNAFYPDMNVYDFERIEVLRGPHGTLYGASSMTGVVRLLTNRPDLNRFEAKTRASFATIEDGGENYRADAAVNIPLIEDRLAMRLVGGYQDLGGWIDKPNDEDANRGDIKTLRSMLRAQPTEALTLDAAIWLSRSSFDAQNIGRTDRTTTVTDHEPVTTDFDTYSLTGVYDFGDASITSATSYIDLTLENLLSLQGLGLSGRPTRRTFAETFSQEIIVQSTQEGPWHWSIGAMYRDAKERSRRALNGITTFDFGDRSKSSALFSEVTRELLNGQVEATLGLRYFHDEFSTAQNINPTGGALLSAEDTEDELTPRVVLAWHPTEGSTVYASYAQGFRSGLTQDPATIGNPLFATAGLSSVKSDALKNYEIGAKGILLDGRVSMESAVYYMDWQDVKASLLVFTPFGQLINALVNGPSASGVGVDAMIAFRPIDRLEIGGSGSWNDLTMDGEVRSGGLLLFNKGDRLSLSPETTANGFVEYSFPLGSLIGRLYGAVNYLSSNHSVTPGPVVFESDSITTTAARFTIDSNNAWSVSLFGDNLNDEDGMTANNSGFAVWQPRIAPRTIGLQVEYRFNE